MKWTDKNYLGAGPAEEEVAQVGSDGYEERAKAECRAYILAIKKVCGEPPQGAALKVEWASHDHGRYAEVVVAYDGNNREAAEYAAKCDEHAPTTWDAVGMTAPGGSAARNKRYLGRRDEGGTVHVTVVPEAGKPYPLPLRLDLRNHSPSGFNHGYNGSGPAQLALALAADVLGDNDRAQRVYQTLKSRVVTGLEGDTWDLTEPGLREVIEKIERDKGQGWKR